MNLFAKAFGLILFASVSSVAQADSGGFACVGGYLYKPASDNEYVGTSECQSARIGASFACVSGYLYLANGDKTYVGTSECQRAKVGNGSKNYVGQSECDSANLAN